MTVNEYCVLDSLTQLMWKCVECEDNGYVYPDMVELVNSYIMTLGDHVRHFGYEHCTSSEFVNEFLESFLSDVDGYWTI